MGIHVVNKGKEGEREVCKLLLVEIYRAATEYGFDQPTIEALVATVQRNQNQSAVGGGDINMLGLSFEVKRCEQLAINAWWDQCTTSAARNEDHPVLIYRKNAKPGERTKWHVVTWGFVTLPNGHVVRLRVQLELEQFEEWFRAWVKQKVDRGEITRV